MSFVWDIVLERRGRTDLLAINRVRRVSILSLRTSLEGEARAIREEWLCSRYADSHISLGPELLGVDRASVEQ